MITKLKVKIIRWALNQIREIVMTAKHLTYSRLEHYEITDIITNKTESKDPAKLYLLNDEIAIIIKKDKPKCGR